MASTEQHKKKLKAEIDKSVALPELLKNHLQWVSSLPEFMQIAILLGEKFTRSKLT